MFIENPVAGWNGFFKVLTVTLQLLFDGHFTWKESIHAHGFTYSATATKSSKDFRDC